MRTPGQDTVAIVDGRIVTEGGVRSADLLIVDGVIDRIDDRLDPPREARVIGAQGRHVLPGLVDVHTHLRDPGATWKEDFATGTRAAAAGGVTTVVAQPNTTPPILDPETFATVREIGERRAWVDFAIAPAAVGGLDQDLAALRDAGACYLDIATGGSAPALQTTDRDGLGRLLAAITSVGLPAAIFANAADVHAHHRTLMASQGRHDPRALFDAYPEAVEVEAMRRIHGLAAGKDWDIHLKQVSCGAAVEVIAAMKRDTRVTAEVTPHHLYVDATTLDRQGPLAAMGPPLRLPEDLHHLRRGLSEGIIDFVATDHAPHAREEKLAAGDDIWASPLGVPGLETFLGSLLAAVHRGELTLPDVVRVAASGPAERFGFVRKGRIAEGFDADLVVVDVDRDVAVDVEQFQSRSHVSPFAGTTLKGRIAVTLVRGRPVYGAQAAPDSEGWGRFVAPAS